MKRTERAELLGLSFDTVTTETAEDRCLELCRGPRASHSRACFGGVDGDAALA